MLNAPQILFICPPVTAIKGGIKYIFRMAETLRAAGFDAAVLEDEKRRPHWFPSTAPIVGQDVLKSDPNQILVLPEDQTQMMPTLRSWPQRKVIYSQNHFYAAYRLNDLESYADYGITHLIGSSRAVCDHTRLRHPKMTVHHVPYGIDRLLFGAGPVKQNRIVFMPWKRPVEAAFMRDLFRTLYPQYRNWEWQELSNRNEGEVAQAMGEAKIFLSLSKLEGFGLTPLEAMASGCVVAGFTGIGGREYATAENGFWANEDDFPGCVVQIAAAINLCETGGAARAAHDAACRATLGIYTPEIFRDTALAAWKAILA